MFKKTKKEINFGDWFCLKPEIISNEEPNSDFGFIVKVDPYLENTDNADNISVSWVFCGGDHKRATLPREVLFDTTKSKRFTKDRFLSELSLLDKNLHDISKEDMSKFLLLIENAKNRN